MGPLREDREWWLKIAKRLPVGRSTRVRHGFEHRANCVITNAQDRYWAYCHACGVSDQVRKDYVKITETVVTEQYVPVPQDGIPLNRASDDVWRVLLVRGMSHTYLGQNALYSPSAARILLPTKGGWVGRAVQERMQPKWLMYSGHVHSYLEPPEQADESRIVIVEDYLSARKVQVVTGYRCIAAGGTRLHTSLLRRVLDANPALVIVWGDGDAAGDRLAAAVKKRFRQYQIAVRVIEPVPGKDPKDYTADEIRNLVNQ